MKKILVSSFLIASFAFAACGSKDDKKTEGDKTTTEEVKQAEPVKETAASIAQQWCELNGKAHKAADADKEAAEKAVKEFEKTMEAKYKSDKAFMDEIEKEVEKCEDASEGK